LRKKPTIMDSPLTAGFNVISYDQRGLGQSEKPANSYTMAAYAEDAAALMDALELESAHVLGLSFGGMVAQEFALAYPERVKYLALFCTSPGGAGGASYPLDELDGLDLQARAKAMLRLGDTRIDDAIIDAHPELVERNMARLDRSEFADEDNHARGISGQLSARKAHDCWARLENITCPVWLAGGRFDGIARPQSMENMAARLPDATLKFYDGGHLFMVQDPEVYTDLAGFFRSTPAGGAP
jgi:3-oxoadipate enol-lactonase